MIARLREDVAIPAAIYLVLFYVFNPHLLDAFSSGYYFGGLDGFQNVWNLWWVDRAVRAGVNPWFTTYLHAPDGTTLLGHTLNPFNGLLAIPLLTFATLVQTYNAIVVFSFVAGGVTAYWLCLSVTRSRAGSLLGGAVFTFSSFHFMHADGHLQLTALEWVPLFVLCAIRFCHLPSIGRGLLAALVLALVLLCDLYYFAYCVFAAALLYGWMGWRRRDWLFIVRERGWRPVVMMAAAVAMTSGVFAGALIAQQAVDPLLGTHSPRDLSMDLLSPFVWGYYWRFRDAVPLWRSLSAYPTENSVHIGLSILGLCIYAWRRRRDYPVLHAGFWILLAAFFFVMSLGPNLHVAGTEIRIGSGIRFMGRDNVNWLALPYAWLWVVFPPWRLAGVPVRMMIMAQLAAAVGAAAGAHVLLATRRRLTLALILCVAAVEYWPAPLRVTSPAVPSYVTALRQLPHGAVLDLASNAPQALYYQTVHEKPIAFGYISRTPTSVEIRDQQLAALIRDGQWHSLARRFGFRYVVKRERAADVMVRGLSGTLLPAVDSARLVITSDGVSIYEVVVSQSPTPSPAQTSSSH